MHRIKLFLFAFFGGPFLLLGCTQQNDQPQKTLSPGTAKIERDGKDNSINIIKPDLEFSSGNTESVSLQFETHLMVPDLTNAKTYDNEIEKAQAQPVMKHTMVIAQGRGKMTFTTENSYIPQGTELRYDSTKNLYVLSDPTQKRYWTFLGAEIGNILEGGPATQRTNYRILITNTPETSVILGLKTKRTNAFLRFRWQMKNRQKSGEIAANLGIWHTKDPRLKPAWSKLLVDFLSIPFQDRNGQVVVAELKSKIDFPVKWEMELVPEKKHADDATAPKLVTTATSLLIENIPKQRLATPPMGFLPANFPYLFSSKDGQTVTEALLAKLPVEKDYATPKSFKRPEDKKR
ncbi:MAG: hypothetical protein V1754_11895 [Pseudomonadota bacterium]